MKYAITTSEQQKYVWFQLPKSASCSIRNFLEKYTIVDSHTKENWRYIEYYPQNYKSYFKFTFVRNPFERLVSCWRDKIVENTQKPQGDEIQYMRDRDFSFSEFVAMVTSDFWGMNGHWIPQCELLIDNFEIELDFIGKVENFDSDMKFVLQRLGVCEYQNDYHSNSTQHKHYTSYYNEKSRLLVEEKYANDIETLGYSFEGK